MVDSEAFLATILEHPDADAPRLVFADWLEEQGETNRAEFIRVQIELSHPPLDPARRSFLKKNDLRAGSSGGWESSICTRMNSARLVSPCSSSQSANTSRGASASGCSRIVARNASEST